MKSNFSLGILFTADCCHIGLVQNKHFMLIEKKYDYSESLISKISKLVETRGLKLTDLNIINVFVETHSAEVSDKVNEIIEYLEKINADIKLVEKSDWIINSNWIYDASEVDGAELAKYLPQYPYLTVISSPEGMEFVITEKSGDSKILGGSIGQSPEALIEHIRNYLNAGSHEDYAELSIKGDSNVLEFEYAVKPDYDIEVEEIKEIFEQKYKQQLIANARFDGELKTELDNNLKADMINTTNEKIFDHIITKIFAIADTFGIKTVSLVGEVWNTRRMEEKIIRVAGNDFKLKFPPKAALPLGSFLAGYDL